MMGKHYVWGILVVLALICTDCGDQPTLTEIREVQPDPTGTIPTHMIDSTSAATQTPNRSSTASSHVFEIGDSLLFASSDNSNCQLPCWEGLQVGVSEQSEVQDRLRTFFGLRDDLNIFDDAVSMGLDLNVSGTLRGGYASDLPVGYLAVYVLVDQDSRILQGIQFVWAPLSPDSLSADSAQRIIRELGVPDYVHASAIQEVAGTTTMSLWLAYKEGLLFTSLWKKSPEFRNTAGQREQVVDFCLDETLITRRDYVVAPFSDLDNSVATSVQKYWVVDRLNRIKDTPSIEVFLGITASELAEIALRDEYPCIELAYDELDCPSCAQ